MGIAVIVMFIVLFVIGFPVAVSILIPCVWYILSQGLPLEMIAQRMQYALDSYVLAAVPLFILVGNLMNTSGITARIFSFADRMVGRLPGGLAQVNIFASLIFSGMSGAALADVGGLGQIEIKAMEEKGFEKSFASAVTVASATVGPIFPPSVPLVIYGAIAGVSVLKLLLSGIMPAILAVILMLLLTGYLAIKRGYPRADRWPSFKEIWVVFVPALPALLTPIILIIGMLSGVFTPTEASALTVLYVFLISFIYRELTMKGIVDAFVETVKSCASVLIIFAAASLFGWILAVELVPQMFSSFLLSTSNNPIVLLAIINLMLLVVGTILDSTTAILLLVPIIIPPLVSVGIDPIHLGIIFVFNIMVGLITPPMGLSLFMVSRIAKVPISKVVKQVLPYYVPLGITLILVTYVPRLILWIPNMLK
ncbi:TRAP transporter large permease [Candidatus Bathyarchaeota archaeon]|nr:TRAP transporter large permease [Candidatus Bathyarchaeota archaeon]